MSRGARGPAAFAMAMLPLVACSMVTSPVPSAEVVGTSPAPAVTVTVTASPTPQRSWQDVLRVAKPSTVRISTQTCDGAQGVGSGAFLTEDRIVTAAHVVADAQTVVIQSDEFRTYGRVVQLDAELDVAVIATDDGVEGGHLALADHKVDQGEAIRVLGYPDAVTERWVSEGIVASNAGQLIDPESGEVLLSGMLAVTAPINPGNSGGPVVDIDGEIIGIVSAKNSWVSDGRPTEGMALAVHADKVYADIQEWLEMEPAAQVCGDDWGPEGQGDYPEVVTDTDLSSAEDASVSALMLHGGAITWGQHETAWKLFSPAMQKRMGSLETWSQGLRTSSWDQLHIHSVELSGDRSRVLTGLRTRQDAAYGRDGQTCSDWEMEYRLLQLEDEWFIDSAKRLRDPVAC